MSVRCPRCRSEEIEPVIYEAWDGRRPPWLASGPARPLAPSEDLESPNFRCRTCGHEWPDPARIEAAHEIRAQFRAGPSTRDAGA